MATKNKKILIASGGTGGHLFPAQALACDLLEKEEDVDILFVGGGLSTNRCFQKDRFPYQEIFSATPYLTKLQTFLPALWTIFKGVRQSFKIIKSYRPTLVVGFGSYHAFPILVAAVLKKVPIVLFEPNSSPGKVNRLFSKWARFCAVQFSQASKELSGTSIEVNMPFFERQGNKKFSIEEARAYFCLDPSKKTLLVFGGSQGATAINTLFCDALSLFSEGERAFQVIHFTGKQASAEEARRVYARLGIKACVKDFEDRMHLAWQAANLVVCRSGAATLAEQAAYEVPGILIPYPHAADDHQKKNALFMADLGAAIYMPQDQLTSRKLYEQIRKLLDQKQLSEMKENIRNFKHHEQKEDFAKLIGSYL